MGVAVETCSPCRHGRPLHLLLQCCCGDTLRKPGALLAGAEAQLEASRARQRDSA